MSILPAPTLFWYRIGHVETGRGGGQGGFGRLKGYWVPLRSLTPRILYKNGGSEVMEVQVVVNKIYTI
jgi:hypothetical protein